jgi:hypothetical protein
LKSEAISHQPASNCLNCGVAISGKFCHECGQEATLHVASAREFMHEFVGHYVALEGKLWKSLGLLVFRPGRLTLEYIQGRRARYVQPLRLYLTFSIIFFAVFKISGKEVATIDEAGHKPRAEVHAEQKKVRETVREELRKEGVVTLGSADGARHWLESVSPALARKADKFGELSGEEMGHQLQKAFFSYAPYAIFCLMPVFAFLLKVLYLGSGRRYGEHLLFALHSNAFAFVMLSILMVTPAGVPFLRPLLGLWLAFYLPTAMRRVYGGSRFATGVRWLVLMFLHITSMSLAIAAAFGLAILA